MLEDIKTPQELLTFMGNNIKYGYIGKSNNRVYTIGDIGFYTDWSDQYYLQMPNELLNTKVGVCWDQVELERYWFSKNKYEFKTIFLWFEKSITNNLPTHTFLAYKEGNKWYWFENSFSEYRGIHEFNNFNLLIADIKKKQLQHSIKTSQAIDDDYKYMKTYQYEIPTFKCNAKQFISNIINK